MNNFLEFQEFFVCNDGSSSLTDDAPQWLRDAIHELNYEYLSPDQVCNLAHSFAIDYDCDYEFLSLQKNDCFSEWANENVDFCKPALRPSIQAVAQALWIVFEKHNNQNQS